MNTEKRTMRYSKEAHPVYSKFKLVLLQVRQEVAIISHFFQAIVKFLFECIVPFPKQLQMRNSLDEVTSVKIEDEENMKGECEGLFPSITKTSLSGKIEEKCSPESPQPCSTGLTTRLLPFKNEKGEIEWTFTDDIVPGTELDCFKMTPGVGNTSESRNPLVKHEHEHELEAHNKHENNLSPTSSNSSNNDSILSNEKNKKKDKEDTPMTSNSSPFSSSDHDEYKSKSDEDNENKTYNCPHCDAVFKIRGYLTRHVKKHAINKAYSCPFHKFSIYMDENNITHKCHPTGGFSRRDTYKTHLKARHFKYPQGVKTKDRASSPGNCSMCGEHFQNSEIWCEIHIEGAECKFLPVGFKGKSIIKNRLKKQLSRQRSKKLEGIESSKLLQTPTSNPSQTPAPLDTNPTSYEYNNANSPCLSTTSGNLTSTNTVANEVSPGTNVPTGRTPIYYNQLFQLPISHTKQSQEPGYEHEQEQEQEQEREQEQEQAQVHEHEHEHEVHQGNQNEYQQQPHSRQFNQQQEYLMFDQFRPHKSDLHDSQLMYEDYDDEFCLDVDQLNKYSFNNYNEILSYLPQNNNHTYQQHVHY